MSPPDRPTSAPGSPQVQVSGVRALNYRYFHTGRYILDRERILCVVDICPSFVEIWLVAGEERLRLKSPSSQQAFLEWYTQSDPSQALGRWLIQTIPIHQKSHSSPDDALASS